MMDRDAGTAVALLQTPFAENYAEASPDGRSLVYVSDESGREEVYVLSLDGGGKSQISSDGGSFPRWRRDGREIVYLAPGNRFMSVTVGRSRATFEAGVPQHLFDLEVQPGPGVPFDLSSDGARLLVNTPIPSTAPRSLGLIVHWPLLVQK